MSLEQHSIDQGYSARLTNLEVAPPVHAWAAIAAQLPNEPSKEKGAWWWGSGASATLTPEEKSKRERVIFWWWTGALLALTAASLLAYYGMSVTSVGENPTPTPNTSAAALVPIAATTTVSNNTNEGLNLVSKSEEDCPEATPSAIVEPTGATSSIVAAVPATVFKSTPIAKAESTSKANNLHVSQVASTKAIAQSSQQVAQLDRLTTSPLSASTPPTTTNPVGLSLATTTMSQLPLTGLSTLETSAPKLPFGPGIGCEDFKSRAGWSFAVRAFGGPGMVFQNYSSTAQTADYENLRDSIETRQLSVHGGLRFEAVNDLGLFLRAGADYMMYRSNIEDTGSPRTRTIIDSVFMEDTQTWRVETRNEVFQEQRNVYNRQHAIVFTAGVGFRKTFGNVSPYIMAEGGYEMLIKRKGDFVLPDGNFVDLAEDNQGLYINDRPGFQYGGVIGVDFALTDRIEVGVSGHYKQLGGLRGSADLLDYKQSTAFGALNLRYTIR